MPLLLRCREHKQTVRKMRRRGMEGEPLLLCGLALCNHEGSSRKLYSHTVSLDAALGHIRIRTKSAPNLHGGMAQRDDFWKASTARRV